VRGQRRISPPRDSFRTAVSGPVVRDDPAAIRLPASVTSPPPVTGTIAAATGLSDNSLGDWSGDFLFRAFPSSEAFSGPLIDSPLHPRYSCRGEKVEHDPGDGRIFLKLLSPDTNDVFLLNVFLLTSIFFCCSPI